MIKVRKISFGQFGIELLLNINLRAISLLREKQMKNESDGNYGTEICSKIVSVEKDFSIKELVPEQDAVFEVCACYGNSVIYCEDVYDKKSNSSYRVYRSTSSKNKYIGQCSNTLYKKHVDVFVVSESSSYAFDQKVTAFDMNLNIIKSYVIGYRDINEYEDGELDIVGTYNNYTGEINYRYPDLRINFHGDVNEAKKYNENDDYTFVTTCYDCNVKKKYLVKFNRNADIDWKVEISNYVIHYNIKSLNTCYYVLASANRGYKHWLMKYSESGELLDKYEFSASGAIITVYNDKIVVVYRDLSVLKPWQNKVAKEEGLLVRPTSMLVIEEWD